MSSIQPLLNEIETATFLNVSKDTLRNWRSKGGGPPFVKIGKAVRYAQEQLREYIEIRTRGAGDSCTRA